MSCQSTWSTDAQPGMVLVNRSLLGPDEQNTLQSEQNELIYWIFETKLTQQIITERLNWTGPVIPDFQALKKSKFEL